MSSFIPNYKTLKKIARRFKTSIKNLIVLAPQNDPYYVGAPSEIRHAQWVAHFVEEYLRERDRRSVHDRAIHYYILSKGIERPFGRNGWKTYDGDAADFAFIMKAIQNARLLGLIHWYVIEDNKNPNPIIMANYWEHEDIKTINVTPENLARHFVEKLQLLNPQLQQAYHIEIWTEKTTINDILIPIAQRYGANLQAFSGQATATRVYELIGRILEISKPVRILYISDFDKYGHNMPVSCGRKIQWFIDHFGDDLDVKLDKILLTEEQVEEYNLPSAPGEENKVELDALEIFHPGETRRIIEAFVSRYIDLDIFEKVNRINDEVRSEFYQTLLEALEPIREQLESKHLPKNLVEDIPKADLVEENSEFLYDSSRDYVDQTKIFKQFLKSR